MDSVFPPDGLSFISNTNTDCAVIWYLHLNIKLIGCKLYLDGIAYVGLSVQGTGCSVTDVGNK